MLPRPSIPLRRLSLAWILAPAIASTALAASPSLTAIRPMGAQRGTEVEVTLSGARLGDAKEILFHQPGITTVSLDKVDDNNVKAKLKIAPDARLGFYDLRLRTATGISELRGFSVGDLKEIAEAEPNNDFDAPQAIALNTTVNGVAENEDVDYFVIEAKKGERITAEIEGIRLGITLFDPYVAILNDKRFELASSDDDALLAQDCFVSILAPEDGKYIIEARESAFAGNGSCLYRLHVGNFPRATAVLPPGGKPGEKLAVNWIGDPAGDAKTEVTLPAEAGDDFGLIRRDDKGASPYPNPFRVSPLENVVETEPNDDPAKATAFKPPAALNGAIEKPDDVDYYTFTAKKGETYDFRVFGRQLGSPIDSVLYVGKKGAGAAASNDDSGGPDSYFRFACPDDGEYALWIRDHLKAGGPDYVYRIEVSPIAPKLAVATPTENLRLNTGVMAVAVPKGNRQAIMIQTSRTDVGGAVNFDAKDLPPGVEMEAPTLAPSQALVPVLFTAKADAELAGSLAEVVGRPADSSVTAPSSFSSTTAFVSAPNNIAIIVWSRTVDKLPVVVTEESPFSIEIVQPKVPLVQSGQMGLKVRAIRKPDFKAPIAVSLPWNPPGVGSGGGVSIPEGQDEAIIPINANDKAELNTWKIVVNGTATGPTGPVMVSSQLADLTVAAPFVGLTFKNASVEQGQATDLAVEVAKNVDFEGEAEATLVGLPNKVTTEPQKFTKDADHLTFHLTTDAASPAGNHTNLFCRVVITQNGEPIVHNIGSGSLRIAAPLPAKPAEAAAAPAVAAKPAEASAKPLSRLEKLRLERKQRQEAAGGE